MPGRSAASLRPNDPQGFDRGRSHHPVRSRSRVAHRAIVVLVLSAIVAASATALASAPAHASKTPGRHHRASHRAVNPTALWKKFPLGARQSRKHVIANAPGVSGPTHPKRQAQPHHDAGHSLRYALLGILFAGIVLILIGAAWVRRKRGLADSRAARQPPPRSAAMTDSMESASLPTETRTGVARDVTPITAGEAASGDGAGVEWRRDGHLLFVPTSRGYTLLECPGEAPPVRRELDGAELGLQGRFRVLKIVASPLPSDERECAYLERA